MDTVCAARAAFAVLAFLAASPSGVAAQQTPLAAVAVADAYFTPSVGALNLISLQQALAGVEDRFVPLKVGAERSRLGLVTGILYRTGKFIGLDVPQDHMLLVVQHEVFGHGARLRELGVGRIGYGFDAPIPYGGGGGVTHFDGLVPDSPLAFLSIESSGVEAQHSMADALADRALATGRFHYRSAWLYFESRYIALTYILDATEFSREGNDIADFSRTFAEQSVEPCKPISLKDLQRDAWTTLADPMLYYAVYGFASSYIGRGEATSPIPTIPLGRGMRFLPSMGFLMTPYGTERSLRIALLSGQRAEGIGIRGKGQGANVTSVTLRVAKTGVDRAWGVDVRMPGVKIPRVPWRISPAFSVWRQPYILAEQTFAPLETGAAATATVVVPLPKRLQVTGADGIYVTAGAKSEGFIPDEQLSGGGVLKAGLTFRLH